MTENPDLKDLRVAVVPSETGNGIDQSSTYEEIVACKETTYYSVPDYFKAQNDEELPALHWSFLLDYNKKIDITGANVDGIDYFSEERKENKIRRIKQVIEKWGATRACELELSSSPCLNSIGNNKNNISELIEYFNLNNVHSIVYQDELELDENYYKYEELPDEIIDEIVQIMEDYDVAQEELMESCKD